MVAAQNISTDVGMTFEVVVDSNPATGCQWVPLFEAGKLRLHRKLHKPASFKAGTGGVDIFVFEAMTPCQTQIRLEQKRAWETAPVRSQTITVHVGIG
jgi:predicted secreted protein